LDRPSVYAKSVRKGTVPTILTLVLLASAGLVQAAPTPAAQGDDEATMRRMVQYIASVGQQQYDRGNYTEAEKTLRNAGEYAQYLDAVEQKKLESLHLRAIKGAAERKRIDETRRAADQLTQAGDIPAARTRLESIQNSEYLSDKERQEITAVLGAARPLVPASSPSATVPSRDDQILSSEQRVTASVALEQSKKSVAETYYDSMTAYHAGDLKTAKEGFAKVLESGQVPAVMTDSIRGYLAKIDATEAGDVGQPVAMTGVSVQAISAADSLTPAPAMANLRAQNTPAGQGESERIQRLYNRSRELYIQGELSAAREGFAEVARSGLISAPPGLRPEDYIAQIDQQLSGQVPLTPVASMVPVTSPDSGVMPLAAQPAGSEGGFIAEINASRNRIRSYAESIVNDAVAKAQQSMAQGDFAGARAAVANAVAVVNDYQQYLGDELYKQHMGVLNTTSDRIGRAEAEKSKQMEAEKQQQATETERQRRTQAEEDRQRRVDELMERAMAYWKNQQYEAALGQLDALLLIDPLHDTALAMKDMVEDMIYFRKQLEQQKLDKRQQADIKLSTEESAIPYADDITYPKNWREIIEKPTRKPDAPFQLDPANSEVYNQLDQIVDLSGITQDTPANEAFETLRTSVQPALNLVVLWRDLQENAGVDPTTAVQFDGPSNVRLGTALENLLGAISDPLYPENPVDYVVNRGVVTVATRDGLPKKKLETRVYDVSDLVSPRPRVA